MKKSYLHHVFFALSLLVLSGCAIYPAVQVAGSAMTGYDVVVLADDHLPRDHVEGGQRCFNSDKMLERRLRERLGQHRLPVSAHVIETNAYLVGQFPDRTRANQAVDVALTIQGLKTITCKFYPSTTAGEAGEDSRLRTMVAQRLAETERLNDIDLRVEVIHTNVILVGRAGNYSQKTAAVAIVSEMNGIGEIVDYISVPNPQPETETNTTG